MRGPRPEGRPGRAPRSEERQRDAERSRKLLIDAALDEFAAHGPAGSRVQDIAERAGVNKQLINYYFGGKDGLYRELLRVWAESEALFADENASLAEIAVQYFERGLADPRPIRLVLWRGLSGDEQQFPEETAAVSADLDRLGHARTRGEIAEDLDPGFLRLALMGMIMTPIALPQLARHAYGLDPRSPEFRDRYAEQLRRLVRHLAGAQDAPEEPAARPENDRPQAGKRSSTSRGSRSGQTAG
ncbi:TetR/AcrR family transcriptional regulator [Streptomyces hoynatensis]|uniref:TetR/AcrR family transcriptional regulator n=1 Tax=Streptomyces hoynatensis TaxID=1141874 RepID=A0A3A9YMV3_9ACTN|nr:TetR family transcriptional regulator [Streptomyces hoynatensis]RKN37601.1 TetR/AcrR family transcriptional regulator [Streptomyces hoynatensis]